MGILTRPIILDIDGGVKSMLHRINLLQKLFQTGLNQVKTGIADEIHIAFIN
jgi:hypothetical protein